MNYYRLHFLYYIVTGFLGGCIIYGIERNHGISATFVNSLFTSYSSLCVTGLTVVETSVFTTGTKVVITILSQMGSMVLMSTVPLIVKRLYLRRTYGNEINEYYPQSLEPVLNEALMNVHDRKILEYHAMGKLLKLIFIYIAAVYILAFAVLSIYLTYSYAHVIVLAYGVASPVAFASFHVISAFTNSGMCLFAQNLIPLRADHCVQLTLCACCLLGNTLFPVAVRVLVSAARSRAKGSDQHVYEYLMNHPREIFTHMFPLLQTYLLIAMVAALNLVEFISSWCWTLRSHSCSR